MSEFLTNEMIVKIDRHNREIRLARPKVLHLSEQAAINAHAKQLAQASSSRPGIAGVLRTAWATLRGTVGAPSADMLGMVAGAGDTPTE